MHTYTRLCHFSRNYFLTASRWRPPRSLRHHYRARNWTLDENHFLVSSSSSFQNGSSGENRVKKFSGEVGVKCHQSCLVALVFCTKLYIKLAVSLCSFSQFSFPFNFRTVSTLVLKFGTLPLSYLFSNTLLAIFEILFCSRVIHRFVQKNGPKLTCRRVFQHNFISKANLKNPEHGFLVHRFYLLREQRECTWQDRFST